VGYQSAMGFKKSAISVIIELAMAWSLRKDKAFYSPTDFLALALAFMPAWSF